MTDYSIADIATPDDTSALLPRNVGQTIHGHFPVWNGTAWVFMPIGTDTYEIEADSSTSTGLRYGAVVPGATPIADQSVDVQHLKRLGFQPTGAVATTVSRLVGGASNQSILVSGQLALFGGAVLRRGVPISAIHFWCAIGGSGLSHSWACLVDQAGNVLTKSDDSTATSWTANTDKALSLATPYTPSVDTPAYLGLCCVGTTRPTLLGAIGLTGTLNIIPYPNAFGATGLTTPDSLGATADTTIAPGTPGVTALAPITTAHVHGWCT